MGWESFYRRRDALDVVIEHASNDPSASLPFMEIPLVREVFPNQQELLLALQYRWTQLLTGYIDVAVDELDTGTSHMTDPVNAISDAWRRATVAQPVLRKILDNYGESAGNEMNKVRGTEYRMLALAAGLAKPHDSREWITEVGATYAALLRDIPEDAQGWHQILISTQ